MTGIVGVALGVVVGRRQRRRAGLPVDLRSLFGAEPGAWHPDSVERRLLVEAAALSFLVAVVGVFLYEIAWLVWDLPHPPIWVLGGLTGGIFGPACAVVCRRRRWI